MQAAAPARPGQRSGRRAPATPAASDRLAGLVHRTARKVAGLNLPNGAGYLATLALLAATVGYGVVQGGHISTAAALVQHAADAGARAFGFGIKTVAITGRKRLDESEIRQAAGIGPGSSVPFLDVESARAGLLDMPWIAEATVRKLYPDRVDITIVEREAFALWQRAGRLSIIARDGTVIAPADPARPPALPLVVGVGAERKAAELVDILAAHPTVKAQVRAAVLVGERRWNLRLQNGIDVRLPEDDAAAAVAMVARLDRDKRLLTRDLVTVDLRLPDRLTLRLSDEASKAREAIRLRATRKKGSDT